MSDRCTLCLTLDVGSAAASRLPDVLAAALEAAPISSLTLRAADGAKMTAAIAKPLIDIAQRKSVAALIADDCELAKATHADGVHISWAKDAEGAYRAARDRLGARFIVGADAGRSRHEAMTLGEAGADYVAFGIPPHVEDRAMAQSRQRQLIAWWSEIFEIPAVAFDVVDLDHATALAATGADFIAVTLPATLDAAAARQWLATYATAVAASGQAA
ncbi:MAG: thiamine phosphate synthase [Hyphomicrobium sp.]